MKLWDKGYTINNLVEKYTVGNDRKYDIKLAKYDVLGSLAHAEMLQNTNFISKKEWESIEIELNRILKEIEKGNFTIEENFEDIHSKVEYLLTEKLGEAGKKIHTARSRNDQILVDLHLYTKAELQEIKEKVKTLFNLLIDLADKNKDFLLPGYTHTQIAMPSSFGLWFSAYAESLIDDIIMLNAAIKISDQNPLGSAAGYGSSFPIDRDFTTQKLGFAELKINSIAAQMTRGKLEKTTAYALATLAGDLSKLSADIILYMSQNFGFVGFPKELTTGSSIMPHKQNPDVWEIMRARCNQIQNLPSEITMLTNNLAHGYHRDFQQLKEHFIDAIESSKDNIEVAIFMLKNIKINQKILIDPKFDLIFSVERVNELVISGLSFRDAYKKVGEEISLGKFKANHKINHQHKGSIGNLCLNEIKDKFNKFY